MILNLSGSEQTATFPDKPFLLVSEDPNTFGNVAFVRGIATAQGGSTSNTAILARYRENVAQTETERQSFEALKVMPAQTLDAIVCT
nr:PEP-utilizing enzyme [Brevibacillus formosus]